MLSETVSVRSLLAPRRALASHLSGCGRAGDWTAVGVDDTRCPPRRPSRRGAGPLTLANRPMHGLYERDRTDGLIDWIAVCHGWCLWRWAGPRMDVVRTPTGQPSPLISAWNPILGQGLVLHSLDWLGLGWPVDPDPWTAEAVLSGRKTGGYFGLSHRDRARWRAEASAAGIAARPLGRRGLMAANAGTLGDHFDLASLADSYRSVLPAELADQVSDELLAVAGMPLIEAVERHEEVGYAVCGLALGYPPEVTAGVLLTVDHLHAGRLKAAEYGAHCPRCDASTGSKKEHP